MASTQDEKVLINTSTLTGIANAVRAKNGESIEYYPNQIANKISNLYLDYTVKFISNNNLFQINSIKAGHKIAAPLNTPSRFIYWSDTINGDEISFPITPTGNMNIYAKLRTTLPNEYQEIEYLQSSASGACYIDTGIKAVNGVDFEVDFEIGNTAGWAGVVGCRQASGQYRYWLIYSGANIEVGLNGDVTSGIKGELNKRYFHKLETYTAGGWKAYFKNDLTGEMVLDRSGSDKAPSTLGNLLLFAVNYTNEGYASMYSYKLKIYSCKMWQTIDNIKVLTRYFVPCYLKSNNTSGMYDIINNVFYENDGTGVFINGPDVN